MKNGNHITQFAEGRLVNLSYTMGHPSFVMVCSFSNQIMPQINLWMNSGKYYVGVHIFEKKLDEEFTRNHLEDLEIKLNTLSKDQVPNLRINCDGHNKPDHYRYF
nr:adenosylhomocysteinase-like [Lepeophtheirus salmonis]